jgi:hypothetical protein
MNNDKLKKSIEEHLALLPKEAQEVINNFDWLGKCEEVGKAHKLLEPEIELLQTETALIILGLEESEYFAKNIEKNVEIPASDSVIIAKEIEGKVLNPIAQEITKKIKEGMTDKRTKWDQNINFIVSGGNYAAFLEQRKAKNAFSEDKEDEPTMITPTEGSKSKNVTDLRDKFTI